MCLPATVMFMTNTMLLWWTLDSVLLPLVVEPKVVKEVLQWSGERKCKVTSIKPKWQAKWTYNATTSLLLNGTFVRRKLLTWTFCLPLFRKPQSRTRSCIKVTSGRMINYPLYDAIHEKNRLHKRATHASAQSSPKFPVYRTGVPNLSLNMYPLLNFL